MSDCTLPHASNGNGPRYETMKATVWNGKPYEVEIHDVPRPKLVQDTDALLRLTTAAICGSDLHIYHGVLGSNDVPFGVGHEGVGIVTEIGAGVTTVKVGDRVVMPDLPDDGHANLHQLDVSFEFYGLGSEFGALGGLQAEYARVPFADKSLLVIPNNPRNDLDYVLLSDIFPTAWGGLSLSGFQPGDVVAVFGAGPVGLLVAYSAILRGAAKVYSVDYVQERLEKAESIGAIPINLTYTDAKKGIKGPADQIRVHEPLGVNRVVDACGYECVNTRLKPQANFILHEATSIAGSGGGIYLIGVYNSGPKSRGQPRADTIPNELSFDMDLFWNKNLTIRGGGIFPSQWIPEILPLMQSGRASPGFVFSTEIGIDEVPEGYKRFSEHKETKVAIKFPWEFEKTADLPSQIGSKRGASEALSDGEAEGEDNQRDAKRALNNGSLGRRTGPRVRRGHGW